MNATISEPVKDSVKLRTFISPVMYRRQLNATELVPLIKDEEHVCWFDSLLNGGIVIPRELQLYRRRPLMWLVSGPPGTGKTTFVSEMCSRLSATKQPDTKETVTTVYYSCESPIEAIKENIQSFRWPYVSENLTFIGEDRLGSVCTPAEFFSVLPKKLSYPHEPLKPQLVVIDSLNVLGSQVKWDQGPTEEDQARGLYGQQTGNEAVGRRWTGIDILRGIARSFTGKCWIVVLILNWEHDQDHDPSFAYLADIETRLMVRLKRNYLLNYIRIVKMRFQDHSRGEHLLKIYPAPGSTKVLEGIPASGRIGLERSEGGVLIMPSIHRHLSSLGGFASNLEGNPNAPERPAAIQVPIDGFSQIVPLGKNTQGESISGFPRYCCTALVGHRGAMKSHVAYATLISHLEGGEITCGVMLSLRDDVLAAVNTLEQICAQQGIPPTRIREWVLQSRLDIAYFAPGYLPPEEFMHRAVVSIEGMVHRHAKDDLADGRHILCVLNGIDHLAARHPLCSEEQMFVPAIISYMTKALVSSIVIAADDDKSALDESGLLPMAELLIRFETIRTQQAEARSVPRPITRVFSQRVPAGASSGGTGYLFRDDLSGAAKFTLTLEDALRTV